MESVASIHFGPSLVKSSRDDVMLYLALGLCSFSKLFKMTDIMYIDEGDTSATVCI